MNRFPIARDIVQPRLWVVAGLAICLALRVSAGTSNTWVNTAGGTFNWNADTNWSPATFPNSIDAVANLQINVTSAQAISVNQQVTVGTLMCGTHNNNGTSQTISNGIAGLIVMSVSSGQALLQKDQRGGVTYFFASLRLDSTTVVDNMIAGAYELDIGSLISGAGGLIKTNAGPVYLGTFSSSPFDSTPNTYSGLTTVAGGTLFANKNNANAIPGDVLIKAGAILQVNRNNVIADTSVITLESNGIFRVSDASNRATLETIGGVTSASPFSIVQSYASNTNTSILTVSDNVDRAYAGILQDGRAYGYLSIVKKGIGAWTISGSNTYNGATTVDGAGALYVSSLLGTNSITLTNNGTLGGSGVISGLVNCMRGKLAPGAQNAAGTLTLASGLSVVTSLTNLWQLGSLSEATNYDKLVISGGSAALGSACVVTLDFSLLSSDQQPSATALNSFWHRNRSWTIVKASGGTISGQFAKISNGTGYASGKGSFSLSGGNGSDVVLNWQAPPSLATSIMCR